MKKQFKSKKLLWFSLPVIALPVITFIACSSDSNWIGSFVVPEVKNNFTNDDWKVANLSAIAKIKNWKDGDTVDVSLKYDNVDGWEDATIRITGLDTPESRVRKDNKWVKTEEPELTYANNAHKFAETLLPKGTEIKIWLDGTDRNPNKDSYGRVLGSIFYGENYSKSYTIQVIAEGWSIPQLDSKYIKEYYRSEYLLADEAAKAFNFAWYNKKGIHAKRNDNSFNYLNDLYKTRGVGNAYSLSSYFIDEKHPDSNKKDNYWIYKKANTNSAN